MEEDIKLYIKSLDIPVNRDVTIDDFLVKLFNIWDGIKDG